MHSFHLLLFLLSTLLLTPWDFAESKDKEAADLIAHAEQLSDIRAPDAPGFQLKANIKIVNEDGTNREGTYLENWASPEMWRTEIVAGAFHQIEVAKDRKLSIVSTEPLVTDFIAPRITAAHEHLIAFRMDGNWLEPRSWKPSKMEDRTSASWSLRCIDVDNPFGWKSDLCFDRTSGVVVAQSTTYKYAPFACLYTDYRKFEGKLFPRSIQCFKDGKLALQGNVLDLERQSPDPSLFFPLVGGRELSYCPSGGTPSRILMVEQMSFPPNKFMEVSFTVGADAKPRDVIVVRSGGDALDQSAMSHLKRWTFEPATCRGKPVDSEMQIVLPPNFAAHAHDAAVPIPAERVHR